MHKVQIHVQLQLNPNAAFLTDTFSGFCSSMEVFGHDQIDILFH